MGCMSRCAKYYLCLFNFVFFLAGGAALALGVWLLVDQNSLTQLISQFDETTIFENTDAHVIRIISYLLIVTGTLTFILSFLGYCGAIFESRCLLCLYGVLKLIILTLEIIVVALAIGAKGTASTMTQESLMSTLKYYASSTDKAEIVTVAWNGIMSQLSCCGVNGYRDFEVSANWTMTGKRVPEVCCLRENGILDDPLCVTSPSDNNTYKGCYGVLSELVQEHLSVVITVAASLVFIDVLSIFLALYLACCYWRPQHGRLGIKADY